MPSDTPSAADVAAAIRLQAQIGAQPCENGASGVVVSTSFLQLVADLLDPAGTKQVSAA